MELKERIREYLQGKVGPGAGAVRTASGKALDCASLALRGRSKLRSQGGSPSQGDLLLLDPQLARHLLSYNPSLEALTVSGRRQVVCRQTGAHGITP